MWPMKHATENTKTTIHTYIHIHTAYHELCAVCKKAQNAIYQVKNLLFYPFGYSGLFYKYRKGIFIDWSCIDSWWNVSYVTNNVPFTTPLYVLPHRFLLLFRCFVYWFLHHFPSILLFCQCWKFFNWISRFFFLFFLYFVYILCVFTKTGRT